MTNKRKLELINLILSEYLNERVICIALLFLEQYEKVDFSECIIIKKSMYDFLLLNRNLTTIKDKLEYNGLWFPLEIDNNNMSKERINFLNKYKEYLESNL